MKALTTKSFTTKSITDLIDPIVDYARPLAMAALPFVIARKPRWGWIVAGSAITLAGVAVGIAINKGWTKTLRENITERFTDDEPAEAPAPERKQASMGGDSTPTEAPVLAVGNNLGNLSKRELYEIARSHQIAGRSMMTKDELIHALEEVM